MHDIFISYSWETKEYNELVISFVNYLRKEGFDTVCDVLKMQEEGAVHFAEMMATGLTTSKKIIILLSAGYKKKADSFEGGVGSEFRFIIEDINQQPQKYILASFESLNEELLCQNVPELLKGREIIDLKSDEGDGFVKLFSKLTDVGQYYFEEIGKGTPSIKQKRIKEFTLIEESIEEKSFDIDTFSSTTPFFEYRISKAFPGIRGLAWFEDPKKAIDRLSILLRHPLNNKILNDPIWYFRGGSCLDIDKYERIADDKCLIGANECKINKLAVYKSSSYYRSFIYVEFKSEEPVGVYAYINEEYITNRLEYRAYAHEEYAVYKGIPITRMEYDDGATVIDGEVVDLNMEAEVRIRYLSPYNIIICAKFNPFNSQLGDKATQRCLDGMLNGSVRIEELIDIAEKLPRHLEDYK